MADPPETTRGAGKHRVFISYRRADSDAAAKLSELCTQAGLEPWTNKIVQPGENWQAKIEEAVKSCDTFLVLISDPSVQGESTSPIEWSSICERRWSNPNVLVVPIRLDSTPLPAFLGDSEYLNAPDEPSLSRCVNEICEVSSDKHRTSPLWHSYSALRKATVQRFEHLVEAIRKDSAPGAGDIDPEPSK